MFKKTIGLLTLFTVIITFVLGANATRKLVVTAELDGSNIHNQSDAFNFKEKSQFKLEVQNEPSSKSNLRYAIYQEGNIIPIQHGEIGRGESREVKNVIPQTGNYYIRISCKGLTNPQDFLTPMCKGQAILKLA